MSEADPSALEEAWRTDQVAAMGALREWSIVSAELNHHMAAWVGLPTSDGNALGQVVWAAEVDEPLSPAELSRRIGMTSGATTVLLDRLERAGLLTRSRDTADRRRVRLRPTEEGRGRVQEFTAWAGTEIADALRATSPSDLEGAATFLASMVAAVETANLRLRRRGRGGTGQTGPDAP